MNLTTTIQENRDPKRCEEHSAIRDNQWKSPTTAWHKLGLTSNLTVDTNNPTEKIDKLFEEPILRPLKNDMEESLKNLEYKLDFWW